MTREILERKLQEPAQETVSVGNDVSGRPLETIEVLRMSDLEKVQQVTQSDEQIGIQKHQIEKMYLNLITLQQPITGDLRVIAVCLRILTDMKYVADQCTDICEIVMGGDFNGNGPTLSHMVCILEEARGALRRLIDVFISYDMEKARAICQYDNVVGSMFSRIILGVYDIITQNPRDVMCEVDMIFIMKHTGRTADHATNIAEWVIYIENGMHSELNEKI